MIRLFLGPGLVGVSKAHSFLQQVFTGALPWGSRRQMVTCSDSVPLEVSIPLSSDLPPRHPRPAYLGLPKPQLDGLQGAAQDDTAFLGTRLGLAGFMSDQGSQEGTMLPAQGFQPLDDCFGAQHDLILAQLLLSRKHHRGHGHAAYEGEGAGRRVPGLGPHRRPPGLGKHLRSPDAWVPGVPCPPAGSPHRARARPTGGAPGLSRPGRRNAVRPDPDSALNTCSGQRRRPSFWAFRGTLS